MATLPGWVALLLAVWVMLALPLRPAKADTAPAPTAARPFKVGDAALGRRLFLGRIPLAASLRGEAASLPSAASRCINCHSVPGTVTAPRPGFARVQDGAPALSAIASRRGGPAFGYDAASLCQTLRTGIDPQQVWLARAMPLFNLKPAQCAALWAYLTQSPGS
jgi:cytochrome c553